MKYSYFFSDVDGTLTDQGLLSKNFFDLLAILKQKKIDLILVSGRSASWGHFFLTHFPINFAIMESGGVILSKNKEGSIITQKLISNNDHKRLKDIASKIRKKFPSIEFAADNTGRITDRALELTSLSDLKLQKKVCQYLSDNNCSYSISNVHLNFTTFEMNKWLGTKYFIKDVLKMKISKVLGTSFYAGDSTNDEVMFEHIPQSLGVKNIKPYLNAMKFHPQTISPYSEIHGVLHYVKHLASK